MNKELTRHGQVNLMKLSFERHLLAYGVVKLLHYEH